MNADRKAMGQTQNPNGNVTLVVTGLDAQGGIFREPGRIVLLDSWTCAFQSRRPLDVDGSLILEFRDAAGRRSTTGGRVVSCHGDAQTGVYRVGTQLEIAQGMLVQQDRSAAPLPEAGAPAVEQGSPWAGRTEAQVRQPAAELPPPAPRSVKVPLPEEQRQLSAQEREKLRAEIAPAIIAEWKDRCADTLKSLLPEIVKSAAIAVTADAEAIVREAAQREIAAHAGEAVDTFGRELRVSLTEFVPSLMNESREQFRQDVEEAVVRPAQELEKSLRSQVRSAEETLQALPARMEEAVLRPAEDLERRLTGQVQSAEESFKAFLAGMEETLMRPAEELESRLLGQVQSAEESFKALSAALTLVKATLQQTEKAAEEHIRSVGGRCEREIRATLLRLAESGQPA